MVSELRFQDLIFGCFPRVGATLEESFSGWAKNSVGDIMDMLMQALEVGSQPVCYILGRPISYDLEQALEFIHSQNIAHRVS